MNPLFAFFFLTWFTACQPQADEPAGKTDSARGALSFPPGFDRAYYRSGMISYENQQELRNVLGRFGIDRIKSFNCLPTPKTWKNMQLHNDSLFAVLQLREPGFDQSRLYREADIRTAVNRRLQKVIALYLRADMKAQGIWGHPVIDWWLADPANGVYGVKVHILAPDDLTALVPQREMRITPQTGTFWVKNTSGSWKKEQAAE